MSPHPRSTPRLQLGPRAWGLIAVSTVVLVVFVSIFLLVPSLIVPPSAALGRAARLKAENDVRTAALQLLGGVLVAGGLYFTARTYVLGREGQITDRFTRAVDQLGSDAPNVRIGAYSRSRGSRGILLERGGQWPRC